VTAVGNTIAAIEQWDSIARADPGQWDRMAGARVLHSHGWLRALEESSLVRGRHVYFVARGGDGLLGAIATRLQVRGQAGRTLDHLLFNRGATLARHLGASPLPALVGGTQVGYANPIALHPGLSAAERGAVRRELLACVERTAAENGWSVCLRDLPRDGSPLAQALADRDYLRTPEMPVACLPITWDSFAGYLAQLKASHRWSAKNVRREMNAARRHGLVIEAIGGASFDPEPLHALLDAHHFRRNREPFPYDPGLLQRTKSYLGDRAMIHVARIGGRLGGVSLGVGDADAVHRLKVGVDPGVGREASLFANLCYNCPIETLTATGCRRIYYGRLLYDFKVRRGCTLIDADLYVNCRNRMRRSMLVALLEIRSRRVAARTAGLPRLVEAAGDADFDRPKHAWASADAS